MAHRGAAVPLVLIPRFTSYLGEGTYTSAPLDVSEYSDGRVTLWRGPLVGDSADGASFSWHVEDSHDAVTWQRSSPMPPEDPVSTTDTSSQQHFGVVRRWMRVVVELEADSNGVAAITCWAVGLLDRRLAD